MTGNGQSRDNAKCVNGSDLSGAPALEYYNYPMFFNQYHPANPAASRLTLDECARIAIQMLAVRQEVMAPLPEGVPFDGVDAGLEV